MDKTQQIEVVCNALRKYVNESSKARGTLSIHCPFHTDKSPSCSVNINPSKRYKGRDLGIGHFFCFGCPARGPWDKLAAKIRAPLFGPDDGQLVASKRQLLVTNEPVEMSLSLDTICKRLHLHRLRSPDRAWRSFDPLFLKSIGAYFAVDSRFDSGTRVLFPIQLNGEYIGALKARWSKDKSEAKRPTYINMPGDWAANYGLFPIHALPDNIRTVWLVEGPRDALRLLQLGIPALAILGALTMSRFKFDLLLTLGVERIVFFPDGDKAGRRAAKVFKETAKEYSNTVKICVVPTYKVAEKMGVDKIDPMEMPIKYLRIIINKYHV